MYISLLILSYVVLYDLIMVVVQGPVLVTFKSEQQEPVPPDEPLH